MLRRSVGPLLVLVLLFTAAPAAAYDSRPCTQRQGKHYCPLWRGWVPVHAQPSPRASVVGYLVRGGETNWFKWQCAGARYGLGRYVNEWWAWTMADNRRMGFVSEVYFSGGANFERDARLPIVAGRIC